MCCVCFALVRAVCFALARLFFRCKTSTSITRGAHHINHDREGVGKKNVGEFFTTPSFQEAGSKGRGLGDQHGDQVHRTTPLSAVHTVHIDCTKRFCHKRLVTFCVLSCSRKFSQTRRHRTREVGRASRWTVSILVCTLEPEGTTRTGRALRNPLSRQMLITCNMCRIFFDFFQVAAHTFEAFFAFLTELFSQRNIFFLALGAL